MVPEENPGRPHRKKSGGRRAGSVEDGTADPAPEEIRLPEGPVPPEKELLTGRTHREDAQSARPEQPLILSLRKNFSEKDWRLQANSFHVKKFLHIKSAVAKAFACKRQ